MNYCSNCGAELEKDQAYCTQCGKNLKETVNSPENNIEQTTPSDVGNKSRLAAGILGILLGALGVHNFYLGYTGKGIAQLLITILSFGLLSIVSGIWALIESIMILTDKNYKDAKGMKLTD